MMLTISKGINQYDVEVRSGNFKKNSSNIETLELFNKEILILGFGRIGRNLIKRCLGFDMKVKVFDPFVTEDYIKKLGGVKVDNLDDGFKTCDYLSLHVPLTEKTKNMIVAPIFRSIDVCHKVHSRTSDYAKNIRTRCLHVVKIP